MKALALIALGALAVLVSCSISFRELTLSSATVDAEIAIIHEDAEANILVETRQEIGRTVIPGLTEKAVVEVLLESTRTGIDPLQPSESLEDIAQETAQDLLSNTRLADEVADAIGQGIPEELDGVAVEIVDAFPDVEQADAEMIVKETLKQAAKSEAQVTSEEELQPIALAVIEEADISVTAPESLAQQISVAISRVPKTVAEKALPAMVDTDDAQVIGEETINSVLDAVVEQVVDDIVEGELLPSGSSLEERVDEVIEDASEREFGVDISEKVAVPLQDSISQQGERVIQLIGLNAKAKDIGIVDKLLPGLGSGLVGSGFSFRLGSAAVSKGADIMWRKRRPSSTWIRCLVEWATRVVVLPATYVGMVDNSRLRLVNKGPASHFVERIEFRPDGNKSCVWDTGARVVTAETIDGPVVGDVLPVLLKAGSQLLLSVGEKKNTSIRVRIDSLWRTVPRSQD